MRPPSLLCGQAPPGRPDGGVGRTTADLVIVLGLSCAVIAVAAHGPANTYRFAQVWQVGAALDTLQHTRWLLPRIQGGAVFRKGHVYTWMLAGALKLTGAHNDFVFCLPTMAATLAMAAMIYFLGRRWYGRRVGLLGACFWVTGLRMSKLVYIALTDSLLAAWFLCSVICADRLLFHPVPRARRRPYVVGFWASLILGAATKGWGVANVPLLVAMLALAVPLWPGFGSVRTLMRRAAPRPLALLVLLAVLRRWRRAVRTLRVHWGVLAFVVVIGGLLAAVTAEGGKEFRQVLAFEIGQRITGAGESPPKAPHAPPPVHLLYGTLPASVFALAALVLGRPRRLLARKAPLLLPICWVAGVVGPFCVPHGFRVDYLFPCFAGWALMAGWAVEALRLRMARACSSRLSAIRHVFGAVVVGLTLAVLLPSLWYAARFAGLLPQALADVLPMPDRARPETVWVACLLPLPALAALVVGVRASLRRQVRLVAGLAIAAMPGVMFLDTHLWTLAARTGDGDRLRSFARRAGRIVGSDRFAVCDASKCCFEIYLGRLDAHFATGRTARALLTGDPAGEDRIRAYLGHTGVLLDGEPELARPHLDELRRLRWLIASDRGLIAMGAHRRDDRGAFAVWDGDTRVRYASRPAQVGSVRAVTDKPILEQGWGRLYLIELSRPLRLAGPPVTVAHLSAFRKGRGPRPEAPASRPASRPRPAP